MLEMPSMEPATGARALCRTTSEVVHHPWPRADFLIGVVYCLPRYIASSPQGVYVGLKPEMHLKENLKSLILVALETPSSEAYTGIEMRCNILGKIGIGEQALDRGSWEVAVIY